MRASVFYVINSTPSLKQKGAAFSMVIVRGNPNRTNSLPLPEQLLFTRVHPIVQDGLNTGREAQLTPLQVLLHSQSVSVCQASRSRWLCRHPPPPESCWQLETHSCSRLCHQLLQVQVMIGSYPTVDVMATPPITRWALFQIYTCKRKVRPKVCYF